MLFYIQQAVYRIIAEESRKGTVRSKSELFEFFPQILPLDIFSNFFNVELKNPNLINYVKKENWINTKDWLFSIFPNPLTPVSFLPNTYFIVSRYHIFYSSGKAKVMIYEFILKSKSLVCIHRCSLFHLLSTSFNSFYSL